jgi:uncharacterized protein DUF6600
MQPVLADEDDPPGRVARLSYMDGAVSFVPAGTEEWLDANPNRPLTRGDRLWTDEDSRAELQIGSAAIRCADHTGVSFLDFTDDVVQLQLAEGAISIQLRNLDEGEVFEVDTPNMAFNLQRPGDYRIEVSPTGDSTIVSVRRGLGEVTGGGRIYTVRSNQQASFLGTDELESYIDQVGEYDDFDQWCHDRDLRQSNAISSRYVPRGVIGYEDLDQYGDWRSEPEYGAIWFPRSVAVGWTPYRNGHWSWIVPWGWTWIDDAPWGFAPFHYGRWAYVSGAWGWCPGPRVSEGVTVRAVYAPALVAWVGSPSLSVGISIGGGGVGVGWFPLAPREVYVPPYHVSRTYVTNINVTNTVVNRVTVLNVYENQRTPSVRYANRTMLTAVPRTAFVSAEPVARNIVRIDPAQAARTQITTQLGVAPEQRSVAPPRPARVRPPIELRERTVVAKRPPPPAPVPFARQREEIAANGGRPLARRETENLEPQRRQPPAPVKVEKPVASPVPVESVAKPEAEAPQQPEPRSRGRGRPFGQPPARGAAPQPAPAQEPEARPGGAEKPNAPEAAQPEPSERPSPPERPGHPPNRTDRPPVPEGNPENSPDRNRPQPPYPSSERSPQEQRMEQVHQDQQRRLFEQQEQERRQLEQRHQRQAPQQPEDGNQQLEHKRLDQQQAQQRLELRKRQQQERERLLQEERKKKGHGKKEPPPKT